MNKGSIAPLFAACTLIGVTGYAMEYTMVGKYHVAHKNALLKKAMENDHHH